MTDGTSPRFQVDLTNCDREPIHVPGIVQNFGFLLAIDGEWIIRRASDNTGRYIGTDAADLIGRPLDSIICADAIHTIRNKLTMLRAADAVERLFGQALIEGKPPFDMAIHLSGGEIVIEMEPSLEDAGEAASTVRSLIARLGRSQGITAFLREGARQVRAITGFDRVKVYRFDQTGAGEVVAEARRPEVDSFLGLHYPAWDIPAQARKLYLRNVFRVIADVQAEPVPIIPQLDADGVALDQSLSVLRAVSPIHIEYLRNMGVEASLSISIIVDGQLWGLFACHHYQPRLPSFASRTAAELFGQMFSLMLESRERAEAAHYETSARALTDRLMATIARDGTLLQDAVWLGEIILDTIPADGVAVFVKGATSFSGLTPDAVQFNAIFDMLNHESAGEVFATDCIAKVLPEGSAYGDIAAGLIAIPLSRTPRDYVVLFRSEQMRAVRWAGNPEKAIEYGPNGPRLTPRKSFEAWSELVKGCSVPFSASELRVAEALRISMLEVLVRLSDSAGAERQKAHERQELLIAELNHRVRNVLSLIRGLVSQSRDSADTVDGFVNNLDHRIQALARAHDQITRDNWAPARLMDLIEVEVGAHSGRDMSRVRLDGPNVSVNPASFTVLALVFHELMTNAAKYGALSDSGTVSVKWQLNDTGDLLLDWSESGGPAVTAPKRRGFGSTIIERSIPHDLGGDAEINYRLAGLHAHFRIPARHLAGVHPVSDQRAAPPAKAPAAALLEGKAVLLVEDSIIIALDGEDALKSMGAVKVMCASTVPAALAILDNQHVDAALLDFNLGAETSIAVARALSDRKLPFLFASGYGEGLSDLEEFPGAVIITKPYGAKQIIEGFEKVLRPPPVND